LSKFELLSSRLLTDNSPVPNIVVRNRE